MNSASVSVPNPGFNFGEAFKYIAYGVAAMFLWTAIKRGMK